jgi:hypothetical protein
MTLRTEVRGWHMPPRRPGLVRFREVAPTPSIVRISVCLIFWVRKSDPLLQGVAGSGLNSREREADR